MKQKNWSCIAITILLASASCSTSVVDSPYEGGAQYGGDGKTVKFQISKNNYTRSPESDDEITSLYLAFYVTDGTAYRLHSFKRASYNAAENAYEVFLANDRQLPDKVVAFANITDSETMKGAFGMNPSVIGELVDADGKLVMSSARYYDTADKNTDVFYTTLTPDNWNGSDSYVNIYLERVAAKVTVSAECGKPSVKSLDPQGNERNLSLELTAWDVIGTDKESYLLKSNGNLSYAAMLDELDLAGDAVVTWNNASAHSLGWAHSVNWECQADAFPAMGEESATSLTRHMKFSEVKNGFGKSAFVHETTRRAELHDVPNARPQIVLVGRYELENNAQTLYRRGNYVYTEDELIDYFISSQEEIYINDRGSKIRLTKEAYDIYRKSGMDYLVISHPSGSVAGGVQVNMVSFQLNGGNTGWKDTFYDQSGNQLRPQDMEKVNASLAEQCGLWERYHGGSCFFTIPVEHYGINSGTENSKTGSYGIVRNHHYSIQVRNISCFGHGVADPEQFAGELPQGGDVADGGDLKYNVTVNPWIEKSQDVEIKK